MVTLATVPHVRVRQQTDGTDWTATDGIVTNGPERGKQPNGTTAVTKFERNLCETELWSGAENLRV